MRKTRGAVAVFASTVIGVATALAGASTFMRIDGIPGEATDSRHAGEIEVLSFTRGAAPPPTTARSAGRASVAIGAFTIVKRIDRASPKLMQACSRGTHIPQATVTARFMTYQLHDVVISSCRPSGGGNETVVLRYGSLQQIPIIASPLHAGPGSAARNKAQIRQP